MNAMADRIAAHDVGSIFLYTAQAHPGEHYPHLESMEQKIGHAHAFAPLVSQRLCNLAAQCYGVTEARRNRLHQDDVATLQRHIPCFIR